MSRAPLASSTSCCFPRGAWAFLAWAASRHSLLRSNSLRTSLNRRTSLEDGGERRGSREQEEEEEEEVDAFLFPRELSRRTEAFAHSFTKLCSLVFTDCMVSVSSCGQNRGEEKRRNPSGRAEATDRKANRSGGLTPCPSKMAESVLENFSKQPCRTGNICMFMTKQSDRWGLFSGPVNLCAFKGEAGAPVRVAHLQHGVPGAVVSQLPQPVDEAPAGLAVDPAGLHHGLALFHQLQHTVLPRESRWPC